KNDLKGFGEGLKRIQSLGFKRIEIELQHDIVKNLLKFFDDYGLKAYGMSSFGPSVVGIVETDTEADDLLKAVQKNQKTIELVNKYISKLMD
ncbi:unnamed protein product, partial [marine sediment metagenome]